MSLNAQIPIIRKRLGTENTNFHNYIKKFSEPFSIITYDHPTHKDIQRDQKLLSVLNELPELSKDLFTKNPQKATMISICKRKTKWLTISETWSKDGFLINRA